MKNRLDRLLRDKLEGNIKLPYREQYWDSMVRMLDENENIPKGVWWKNRTLVIGLLVILISAGVWYVAGLEKSDAKSPTSIITEGATAQKRESEDTPRMQLKNLEVDSREHQLDAEVTAQADETDDSDLEPSIRMEQYDGSEELHQKSSLRIAQSKLDRDMVSESEKAETGLATITMREAAGASADNINTQDEASLHASHMPSETADEAADGNIVPIVSAPEAGNDLLPTGMEKEAEEIGNSFYAERIPQNPVEFVMPGGIRLLPVDEGQEILIGLTELRTRKDKWNFAILGCIYSLPGTLGKTNVMGPGVGLEASYAFNNRLSLLFGIDMYQLEGDYGTISSVQREIYSFGAGIENHRMELERLYKLSVPVRLAIQNYRYQLSAGIGIDYFTAGRSTVKQGQVMHYSKLASSLTEIQQTTTSDKKTWADLSERKRLQPYIITGAEYQWTDRISTGMDFYFYPSAGLENKDPENMGELIKGTQQMALRFQIKYNFK